MLSFRFALGAAVLLGAASGAALAAGDLSRQTPIEVTGDLGSPGKHEFAPKQLKFETGKLYKLILRNTSSDPRQRPALRHQDQRRQDPRRARHDRRDRDRVSPLGYFVH